MKRKKKKKERKKERKKIYLDILTEVLTYIICWNKRKGIHRWETRTQDNEKLMHLLTFDVS